MNTMGTALQSTDWSVVCGGLAFSALNMPMYAQEQAVTEAANKELVLDVGDAVVGTVESAGVLSGPTSTEAIGAPSQASLAKPGAFDQLQKLESEILERSMRQVNDSLHWEDIDADTEEPPGAWVEEMGMEAAMRRLNVAKAAWRNAKEAPVGLNMARTTMVGIMKKNAMLKGGAPTLNVQFVTFSQPAVEVIDVEAEDR